MFITVQHAVILLLITAMLFYLLPQCKIQYQILVILIWLLGVSSLMFTNYKTDNNQIITFNIIYTMEI